MCIFVTGSMLHNNHSVEKSNNKTIKQIGKANVTRTKK